jgi:N-acylneuraminate cytidylyltransferase/CMP-N,N'-diacetyllegionaminic acid synthase
MTDKKNEPKARVLAIIPAREGSKGLPGKNIRLMCGKPLLVWSIESALQCSLIDDIVVSTDSPKYAEIAKQYGALVPYLRSKALSTDKASSVDVILDACEQMKKIGKNYTVIVLLEPTSPIRRKEDLYKGIDIVCSGDSSAVVSVARCKSSHPAFLYRKNEGDKLMPYLNEDPTNIRRQDIDELFYLDGSFYVSTVSELKSRKTFYHNETKGIEVSEAGAWEIDSEIDFLVVESIMEALLK